LFFRLNRLGLILALSSSLLSFIFIFYSSSLVLAFFCIATMKFFAALIAGGLSGLALAAPTATINSLEKRAGPNDVCPPC
jgi:hypothetical protein